MECGKRVTLRLLRESDLAEYHARTSDLSTRSEFLPTELRTETSLRKAFAEDGMWSDERGVMLIVDPATDRALGEVVYFKPGRYLNGYELGYAIFSPADRGQGYGSEAFELFVRYMFETKNVWRLQVAADPSNAASIRLAEKIGFRKEGHFRQAVFTRGAMADLAVFSLLRNEWASS